MVVRQHQARRSPFEGALEQQPIGYPERTARPAGYQLVAEESAGAVEVGDEQRFAIKRAQTIREPVDKPALERCQEVSRTYQPIQAGSRPKRRSRRRWNRVPSKRTTKTASVGPLFMVM